MMLNDDEIKHRQQNVIIHIHNLNAVHPHWYSSKNKSTTKDSSECIHIIRTVQPITKTTLLALTVHLLVLLDWMLLNFPYLC